jgi:hypothetical protein
MKLLKELIDLRAPTPIDDTQDLLTEAKVKQKTVKLNSGDKLKFEVHGVIIPPYSTLDYWIITLTANGETIESDSINSGVWTPAIPKAVDAFIKEIKSLSIDDAMDAFKDKDWDKFTQSFTKNQPDSWYFGKEEWKAWK